MKSSEAEHFYEDALSEILEATRSLRDRKAQREQNIHPDRPTEEELKKLNSSMKNNSALIRKIKQINEDNYAGVLKEIEKTNQSKYVSETVGAIREAPLKTKDIPAAIAVSSALHRRYSDFADILIPEIARIVGSGQRVGGDGTEEVVLSLPRRRSMLRFLVELFLHGLFRTHTIILQTLKQICNVSFQRERDESVIALSLMTAFVKAGRDQLLGIKRMMPVDLPSDMEERASAGDIKAIKLLDAVNEYKDELQNQWQAPTEVQQQFRALVDKFFSSACAALVSFHKSLESRRQANEQILTSRGDLPESLALKFEEQNSLFETLQRATAALAEAVDQTLPELSTAAKDEESVKVGLDKENDETSMIDSVKQSIFEDEEAKSFYEQLPNIRDLVPAVLLGEDSKSSANKMADEHAMHDSSPHDSNEYAINHCKEEDNLENDMEKLFISEKCEETCDDINDGDDGATELIENGDEEYASETAIDGTDGPVRALDAVFSRLSECVSKELCDQFSIDYCFAGGAKKRARQRLCKALSDVPQGAIQLVPYYSRIIAMLSPVFSDISSHIVAHLERESRGLRRRKDATTRTLEPRLRNSMYIAELVKFGVFPPGTAFLLLKGLLDDFSGHNVDAACAFIECAGRYLSRRPDTSARMNSMLEIAMKLKSSRNLDPRQTSLVDSAYYAVKHVSKGPKLKERTPVNEYIRYLLYDRLDESSVSYVIKKLRRLHWNENGQYVQKSILRTSRKGKYSQLAPLASLVSELSRYHPWLGVTIVDAVLEEIVCGLDSPDTALYQQRVSSIRFLGHLYVQRMASSPLIFGILHILLAHAHSLDIDPEISKQLDPPGNFFRIRLICALLDSVGPILIRSPSQKKRLDDFIIYLSRYILAKPPLPLDVDLDLQELFARLKLKPPSFETYDDACKAVAAIEMRAKSRTNTENGNLNVIDEDEEEENVEDAGDNYKSSSSDEDEGGYNDEPSDIEERKRSEDGSSLSQDESEDLGISDEESESDIQSSDDDNEYNFGRKPERTEADEEFDRELAALTGGRSEKGSTTRPPVGSGFVSSMGAAPSAATSASKVCTETMALRVMLKRPGGREDRTGELQIPVPSIVAQRLRDKEAEEASERAAVKRMVLAAKRRADEEEKAEERAAAEALQTQRRGKGSTHRKPSQI